MSKWIATLLMIGLLSGNDTYAQNKPIACQDDAAGGLSWVGGRWQTTSFTDTRKFILVLEGKSLNTGSVGKAFIVPDPDTTCRIIFNNKISCSDTLGGYLMFDPKTMKGAISQLLGGTSLSEKRDTLSVRAFTCQPF